MAYYQGVANSLEDLLSALHSALLANDWQYESGWFSKEGCSVSLEVVDFNPARVLRVRGRSSSGVSPVYHGLGDLAVYWNNATREYNARGMSFPVTYQIFVHDNPNECYLLVKYDNEFYQWLAFGRMAMPLEGSGVWTGGTAGAGSRGNTRWPLFNISSIGGSSNGNADTTSGGLFWVTSPSLSTGAFTSTGAVEWAPGVWEYGGYSISGISKLVSAQPSAWNDESVLISIKPLARRPENKVLQVGEIQHARYLRIDYYEPGDIIQLGSVRWMVFPFYRKNSQARDPGGNTDHTGTFGWVIRYDGP